MYYCSVCKERYGRQIEVLFGEEKCLFCGTPQTWAKFDDPDDPVDPVEPAKRQKTAHEKAVQAAGIVDHGTMTAPTPLPAPNPLPMVTLADAVAQVAKAAANCDSEGPTTEIPEMPETLVPVPDAPIPLPDPSGFDQESKYWLTIKPAANPQQPFTRVFAKSLDLRVLGIYATAAPTQFEGWVLLQRQGLKNEIWWTSIHSLYEFDEGKLVADFFQEAYPRTTPAQRGFLYTTDSVSEEEELLRCAFRPWWFHPKHLKSVQLIEQMLLFAQEYDLTLAHFVRRKLDAEQELPDMSSVPHLLSQLTKATNMKEPLANMAEESGCLTVVLGAAPKPALPTKATRTGKSAKKRRLKSLRRAEEATEQ